MESSKIYGSILICMLFIISSATPILGCGYCGNPPKKHKPTPSKPKPTPTPSPTPIVNPPGILPPILNPPITLPPVVTLPPILPIPPILPLPPVTNPPSTGGGGGGGGGGSKGCPPPPAQATCPIDTLKLGACVDLLGGLVHIGVGDPVVNQCCPVLQGLVEAEAAVCLCTTLKLKLLNLNIYVPLALQLLVACGKTPPPGYTCSV